MKRTALGVLVAAASGEVLLRQDEHLPSMAAHPRAFVPEGRPAVLGLRPDTPGCIETDTAQPPASAWGWMVREGQGDPLKMLVVGDSVTMGHGVKPSETWAVRIGKRLAAATERPVEVVNAGVNASGYCGAFRMIHHHLAHEDFDRVVVGLFADDFEQRAVVLDAGVVRANPEWVGGMVGWLGTHSYAFNWVWLQILQVAVEEATEKGTTVPAYVVPSGRSVPTETLDNFVEAIHKVRGESALFVLNAPAGQGLCEGTPPGSECDWMGNDLDLMADLLNQSGVDWVDNRRLFIDDPYVVTLGLEQAWFKRDGRLPVHPSPHGHERIANSIPNAWFTAKP